MHTQLPGSVSVDYSGYLDAYLRQPDAVRRIPGDRELLELARKSIVREQLALLPLPQGEAAQQGDTAVLRVTGSAPRFNKERVTVTLGRGLYSKELEEALIGHGAGQTVTATVQEQPVTATVLELRRKQAPEPTDEMVQALQVKDHQQNLIRTVTEYEAYIRQEKTMEVLATVNCYVMEKVLADCPALNYDEEDIRILGELEREFFIRMFRETEGIDLRESIPRDWQQNGVHTLDDFIASRRDWYRMKIQQCLLYLNILGLPCRGETDPLDHYEVLSELQLKMFDMLKGELERRNGA